MALTKSLPASIFTPEGNSLALFIDVADGTLKLKDVFGDVELFSDIGGGGGLKLKDDALMTATLTEVVDKDNTPSVLRLSTIDLTNFGGGAITTNTAFGNNALIANTTGGSNTAIGHQALKFSTGNSNSAVGTSALLSNTTGSTNSAFGVSTLFVNTTGSNNSAVGSGSLSSNTTGNSNSAMGVLALQDNISGSNNSALGRSALGNNTASNNTAVGFEALNTNISGANNTAIGHNTGIGIETGSNNTILGANVTGLSATLANNVIIADGSGNQRLVVDGSGNVGLNNGTSTTQATSVIRSLGTNSGIALVPNGTGAITADIPDGTATGGNARGINAVDLQQSRTLNTQIALNNFSFIGGGKNNTVNATYGSNEGSVIVGGVSNSNGANYGFIGGGANNQLSGNDNFQVIVGGNGNVITASGNSFIGGGSGNLIGGGGTGFKTISGGQSNSATGGTHATIVGGQSNVSSGKYAISGGGGSTSSGDGAVALGGSVGTNGPIASSSNCFAIGLGAVANSFNAIALGRNAKSINQSSIAMGLDSNAYICSQYSYGSKFFSDNGDCQFSNVVLSNANTNFTGTIQIFNSAETSTLNINAQQLIPTGNNRVWNVAVKTVAVVIGTSGTTTGVTVGDVFMENKSILFKKIGGVSSVVDLATDNVFADGGMGTSSMASTAGAQELVLTYTAPTFVGGGNVLVRVVSKVELVEVAFA